MNYLAITVKSFLLHHCYYYGGNILLIFPHMGDPEQAVPAACFPGCSDFSYLFRIIEPIISLIQIYFCLHMSAAIFSWISPAPK